MFTTAQINEVLKSIDYHYSMIIQMSLGNDILSNEDLLLLQSHGINTSIVGEEYPPYLRMFYLGRLASILREEDILSLTYNDFSEYLKKKQFVPLSKFEKKEYEISRQQTYNHIKGLGERHGSSVRDVMLEINKKEIIKETISEAVDKRVSNREIISRLGHKTGDWERDWHRIVETEMANIYNQGQISQLYEKYGAEHQVWKEVYPQACRHCIKLYTTAGIGSEPKIFTIKELIGNGTNIGRKVADWMPVVDATHPFCRCQIYSKFKNQVWNEENKRFKYQSRTEEDKWGKGKIKITVNNKEFFTH